MIPIEQSVLCEHRRDKRLVQRILFVFHLNIKRLQCVCLYSVIFVIVSSAEIFLFCLKSSSIKMVLIPEDVNIARETNLLLLNVSGNNSKSIKTESIHFFFIPFFPFI